VREGRDGDVGLRLGRLKARPPPSRRRRTGGRFGVGPPRSVFPARRAVPHQPLTRRLPVDELIHSPEARDRRRLRPAYEGIGVGQAIVLEGARKASDVSVSGYNRVWRGHPRLSSPRRWRTVARLRASRSLRRGIDCKQIDSRYGFRSALSRVARGHRMRKRGLARYLVLARQVWRDLLFRGFVLAALIVAAASFAIGFVGDYPRDAKSQNSEKYTEYYGNEAERSVANYTFWLDILTGALAISTFGLWVATIRGFRKQTRDTRHSLDIASKSARAAQQSADVAERALVLAERPYIFVFGVSTPQLARSEGGEWYAYVEYIVANYGRTPAIIEEVRVGAMVSGKQKIIEPLTVYEDNPLFIAPILPPMETTKPIRYDIVHPYDADAEPEPLDVYATITVTPDESRHGKQIAAINLAEGKRLFFRVIVKYHAPFTQRHETGACWAYDPCFDTFDTEVALVGNYQK